MQNYIHKRNVTVKLNVFPWLVRTLKRSWTNERMENTSPFELSRGCIRAGYQISLTSEISGVARSADPTPRGDSDPHI